MDHRKPLSGRPDTRAVPSTSRTAEPPREEGPPRAAQGKGVDAAGGPGPRFVPGVRRGHERGIVASDEGAPHDAGAGPAHVRARPPPMGLLEGSGKYVHHVKVHSPSDIDERAFSDLLKQAAGVR